MLRIAMLLAWLLAFLPSSAVEAQVEPLPRPPAPSTATAPNEEPPLATPESATDTGLNAPPGADAARPGRQAASVETASAAPPMPHADTDARKRRVQTGSRLPRVGLFVANRNG